MKMIGGKDRSVDQQFSPRLESDVTRRGILGSSVQIRASPRWRRARRRDRGPLLSGAGIRWETHRHAA